MKIKRKDIAGDAIQWTGKNTADVMKLIGAEWGDQHGVWLKQKWKGDGLAADFSLMLGNIEVAVGDWVVMTSEFLFPLIFSDEKFTQMFEAAQANA